MLEHYEIENIEQLRAIADLLRLRIIDLLKTQPMTVTQLGEALGEAPARVHYHVRELEKVGLLRLVETREKGGILEKYYQPVARDIAVEKQLLSAPPADAVTVMSTVLSQMKEGFLRAFRHMLEQKVNDPYLGLGLTHLYMTAEEMKQLEDQMIDLFKPYEQRRGIEGEQEMVGFFTVYPSIASPVSAFQKVPEAVTSSSPRTWAVGFVEFRRSDLEKALAEGRRLQIEVIGVCRFADDIPADLVERAVEHFHLTGKLYASPAVREVLLKKAA